MALTSPQPSGVTRLLLAWGAGDPSALDKLLPIVYTELRRRAAGALRREAPGHTLQVTALVNEVYLRLVDQHRVQWQNRAQFFGVAAGLMRRILVDHARTRLASKRGGDARRVTLGDADAASADPRTEDGGVDVLALHEALARLSTLDPDQGRIVELRYFGGLTIEETAEAVGIAPSTVKREWVIARAWLRRELG